MDINTIRAWLGHVFLDTTNMYAEIDLDMKSKALAKCEINGGKIKPWREDVGLMAFLKSLWHVPTYVAALPHQKVRQAPYLGLAGQIQPRRF